MVQLGRYEILEEIAGGGQATVYRARDTELGRTIALKVLHPNIARDPEYLERFMREARLAGSLSHPNIATVYEVGHDGGSHFIAMEYLPESLRGLLRDQGPLPWRRALEIVRQIASGLQAAHSRDVVHRDLKPHNVLRSTSNGWKVSDFGIARSAELDTITVAGAVLGTPQYMSPEQARGDQLDARSDLFSTGVVLHELLTGRTPLDGQTPQQVVRHHLDRRSLPLQGLVDRGVPDRVIRIVRRLTEPAPSDRYPDAEALIAEVDATLGGAEGQRNGVRDVQDRGPRPEDRHAGRPPAGSEDRRSGRSLPRWLLVGAASLLVVGTAMAFGLYLLGVFSETPWAEEHIPDDNLRAALGGAVGMAGKDLKPEDLASLTTLEADETRIEKLTGLEHASGITTLSLDGNRISDLKPLAGLTSLRELSLDDNQVDDLSPLSGLVNLEKLWLGNNRVRDLAPLSGLTELRDLKLLENQVSDLAPIAGLYRLEWLDVASNEVSDIGPIGDLTRLKGLWLWNNDVSDLRPVARLGKLEHLDFRWNQVSDLGPVGGLTSLRVLDMGGNSIEDLGPVSDLTRLEALYFWGNRVEDLTPVAGLIRLEQMDFDRNRVSDLAPLADLTGLVRLYARNNGIRDLTPLGGLRELRTLLLDGNLISDIGPLADLTKIGQDPPLSDKRDGVPVHLGLADNMIADCKPLVDNPGLGRGDGIDLRGNPLNTECQDTHRPALEKRGVQILYGATQ